MSLQSAIERGVKEGFERNVGGIVETVCAAIWTHKWYPIIAGGQLRLIEAGVKPVEAWDLARKVIIEWARDEGVKHGDPRFGWDAAAGRTIVEECEIEHWELSA